MIDLLGIPYDSSAPFQQDKNAREPALNRLLQGNIPGNHFAESGAEIIPNVSYNDLGDLHVQSLDPAGAFQEIRNSVLQHIRSGRKLLCLGGDHSVPVPVVDAHTDFYNDLHVLQFGAHFDYSEGKDESPSMSLFRLLAMGRLASLTWVGMRALSVHQREEARKYGVQLIEMKDLQFDFLLQLTSPVYISLNLEVLDPAYAPGVGHREPGGMSTRQLLQMLEHIKVQVAGADIVGYHPAGDTHGITALVVYKMMKELLALMLK